MHCYPVTISRRAKIPNQSLDRYCAYFYGEDNFLSSFIFLLSGWFLVRSRCNPLRLQANEIPSALQSNKICSGTNDRLEIIGHSQPI